MLWRARGSIRALGGLPTAAICDTLRVMPQNSTDSESRARVHGERRSGQVTNLSCCHFKSGTRELTDRRDGRSTRRT